MKRVILTILLSSLGLVATLAQSQLGMNYQAVIRNAEGKIIADKEVGIQVSILKESTKGTAVYTEAFKPKTNQFGLINLIIGKDQAKSGEYSSIDWSAANYFLKIELDAEGGTTYKEMGTSQLLSVPYANYAFNSASSWEDAEANISTKNKVKVISDGKNPEAPLLEVVNAKGETIFAVYENGVKIILDEETGGEKTRGGFAISGRTTTKGEEADILTVTPSLTQVFVSETSTKTRGGFAISGRTTTKATVDLLNITPELTQFYVDENTTKTRGGFAISGRTTTKEGEADILTVTPKLTQVFVEESTDKTRGGFAISGRTTTKESGIYDVLTVLPERTDIYVKPSPSKNSLPIGFGVHGLTDNTLESTELFSISNAGTYVATPMAVSLNVTTGIIIDITQTSAMGGGKVADACCVTNLMGITSGIVYHTDNKLLTVEEASNLTPDVGGVISAEGSDDFSGLQMLNLKPGTKYKVRAFATDADGLTGYGLPREFTTLEGCKVTINVTDGETTPLLSTANFWEQDTEGPILTSTGTDRHIFTQLSEETLYAYKVEAVGFKPEVVAEYSCYNEILNVTLLPEEETNTVKFIAKNQHEDFVPNIHITADGRDNFTNSVGEALFYFAPGESIYYYVNVPITYEEMEAAGYDVTEGDNTIILNLQKKYKVTFIVKDHNGMPYEDFNITLTRGEEIQSDGYTTEKGVYEFLLPSNITEGDWTYTINRMNPVGGDPVFLTNGILTIGKTDVIKNVKIPAPIKEYTVKFKITDNTGSFDVEGAVVRFSNPTIYSDAKNADSNGEVTFTKVLASEILYELTIEKDGDMRTFNQYIEENMKSDEPTDPAGTLTITITLEP